MTVAYVVSRFPHVSETFIVREMDGVEAQGIDVLPRSLFPPADATVHAAAERWVPRLRRPSAREGLVAIAAYALRRPATVARVVGAVVSGHARSPRVLVRALATLPLAAALARSFAADGVRHVHAHYATYPALAAWAARRLADVPYSFTAHAHDLYVDQSMLGAKVAEARFVVAISEFNRRFLEPYRGAGAPPVEVVHCGVDVTRTPFRERRPPASGPVRALCVASLQEYKGHRVLLDALAHGGPGLERLHVDCVGGGALRDELEQRAAELGLAERVRFLGPRREDDVAALFDRADLFVLPSVVARDGQMEGIPVALMEALAHGVPAVSTALSGIPELVRDGTTGLLARPGDAASLAAALRALLDDPEAAAARARAGRELVEREFDLAATSRRMAELLRDDG
ncbi:MAG TPA: glycosyltransferase [Solirubrobacteraceae bacterium]|nr:glycosyltransferase [Solirubrobacteraceae bacterium]